MGFNLADEIVLLGLDDHTGKCLSQYADFAHSAAILADLSLRRRIDPGQPFVTVPDPAPTGDPLLDDALLFIGTHRRRTANWIRSGAVERGRERTLESLVAAAILERSESRMFGLFTFRRYPAHDGRVEAEIRDRLHSAVAGRAEPEERTRLLLGIASAAGLLKTFLSGDERRQYRDRIRLLTDGDPVTAELRRVVERAEADAAATAAIASMT